MHPNHRWIHRVSLRAVAVLVATLTAAVLVPGCAEFVVAGQQNARMYGGPVPFTLVNDSGQSVCYVRISPSGSTSWGDDWLGSTEIVHFGMARTFNLAVNGVWDLRVETCTHAAIVEARSVRIAGPLQLSLSALGGLNGVVTSGGEAVVPQGPWQNHVTTNVTTNVAGGSSPGADDVITLRDGTLLRGHVAELHPSQHLTIVLLTGETRTLDWADLATATGPAFPLSFLPPPPTAP